MRNVILLLLMLGVAPNTWAELTLRSGNKPAQLLELYTSQGCSSCPPADEWLSQLKSHPGLWERIIPVAFHVDYWDWIGWKDPFAQKAFSSRQRNYKTERAIKSVYTPGFVVDGKEWRGWFDRKPLPAPLAKQHPLVVKVNEGIAEVNYSQSEASGQYHIHMAVLGFDLTTPVKRGENTNKTLSEDFVALWYEHKTFKPNSTQFDLPNKAQLKAQRLGLAVWVTPAYSSEPVQAVGGWW